MSDNFNTCFQLLLGSEGGYTVDNGGPTRWGITQRVARMNGYMGDMKLLPVEVAKQIAQQVYWTPFHCDELALPVAFQVFDTAYNGGHPIQWLQEAAGVAVDGRFGPMTQKAVTSMDAWKVVALFNALRLEYLASLKQPVSADGRMNRIAKNLRLGELK